MTLGLFVLAGLLGLIPATIAGRKGGSFVGWWIFGALLWIVALPMALLMKDGRYGSCPWCQENLRVTAKVCPHCQRDVTPIEAS